MARARRQAEGQLSEADWERVRTACGRKNVDLSRSVLGPGTVMWRVNRELAVLGGGGCALMLQVAHPLVAAGVARYSNYKREPLQRLYRTLDLMLTITFSPAAEAIAAVRQIERRHAKVQGELPETVGKYPKGTKYDANAPDLQLWVHATLVDTAPRLYEMFIGPLSDEEHVTYYEESKVVGRMLGVPPELMPKRLRDFQDYMRRMVNGDTLAVGEAARDIAASIVAPSKPVGLKYLLPPLNLLTVSLLPERLRAEYGQSWSTWQEYALRALVTTSQLAISVLPEAARFFPHARQAMSREGVRRPPAEGRVVLGDEESAPV